ncbi:glutamyl-tRNA amidotransferase [Acidovorax sp. Root219]|nr:glutamyl-tRNA amidotransferase [Acidovorax sp. Root219]
MNTKNSMASMTYAPLEQLAQAIACGELSSEALLESQLARIAQHGGRLHAFTDVYADEARAAARGLDQMARAGIRLGPLHGVTVAVKDLFEVEGKPIAAGSKARPPRTSTASAAVVERLRAAGAVVIGKTHTVEFAFGGWGTNAAVGTPWNPWDLRTHRTPGGSSSGSAVALAAGLCTASIGTDTGGSVRIPAGLCGVVGLKTTRGLISRHGLIELCPTHDTVGPLTRTVRDSAILLDVLSGPDPRDAVSLPVPARAVLPQLDAARGVAGMRMWVLPEAERVDVDPDVLAACDEAVRVLEGLGLQRVERTLPQSLAESMRVAGSLMSAEGYANLGTLFEQEGLEFDPHVRRRILLGRDIGAAQYLHLLRLREQAKAEMLAAMDGIDVCAFPTNAIAAIPLTEVDELATPLSRFGRFVNLLDLCALAVPAGFTCQGLPVSLQFIARPFDEATALRVGHAFEQATRWYLAVPPGLG